MELKLAILCHLLNVPTKFQIDILKHFEKKSENMDGRMSGRMDIARHNTYVFQTGA